MRSTRADRRSDQARSSREEERRVHQQAHADEAQQHGRHETRQPFDSRHGLAEDRQHRPARHGQRQRNGQKRKRIGKVVGRQRRQGLIGRQPVELAQESQVGQRERGTCETDCRTEDKRSADAGPERGSGPAGRPRRRWVRMASGSGRCRLRAGTDALEIAVLVELAQPACGIAVHE